MTDFQLTTDYALARSLPQWAVDARIEAHQHLGEAAWPVFEKFDYFDWPLENLVLNPSPVEQWPEEPIVIQDDLPGQIVHVGNDEVAHALCPDLAEQGVILMDLFEAMNEYPDLVQRYMHKNSTSDDKMATQLFSHMTSGVFVYIPDNVTVEESFSILTHVNNTVESSLLKYLLVVVGRNASVNFLEEWKSYGNTDNLVNTYTHIIGQAGSKINYTSIDSLSDKTTNYLSGYAFMGNDSQIRYSVAALSQGDHLGMYEADAVGRGSHAEMEVLALSNKKQKKGFDTGTKNIGTHSVGYVLQHGAVLDQSFLSFNGITNITQEAKHSDGHQTSRLLMLSEEGRGDVNPILLIDQHEVTAGHSASAGQLDKEQLYYLQSRGIDRRTAEKLVTRGFLGVVLERISSRVAQDKVVALIDERLS